jgi:3-oxoacyl-[acyl-carrier-protein] synthase II
MTAEIAPRVAVTFSTAVGGLDAVLQADRAFVSSGDLPPPYVNPNSCMNMVGGKISILTGATGPIVTTCAACATGTTSIAIGAMFLEAGMADVAITGAVDCSLVEPIVAGFATMNGAFRRKEGREREPPERASRPFSADRRGFVVSEGSGAVILATRAFARAHGLGWAFEVAGWGMTADAHHFVAPNRRTVARAIAEAIESAGLTPGDIDAINAHAASTKVGDQVEVAALRDIFGDAIPPISANKSQIGHAMGASSIVEAIFALESMRRGILLPTINHTPDPELPIDCVSEGARALDQEFVLKNAFGFGGSNACVVLARCES